jgi:hypothetical protein
MHSVPKNEAAPPKFLLNIFLELVIYTQHSLPLLKDRDLKVQKRERRNEIFNFYCKGKA